MLPQAVKKLFDPQQIKHVGAMREKYFSTGDMREITGVRKEIKMGWQLSYTAGFGEISPDKPVVTDLAQRQRKNQSLIDVAKPYMKRLYAFFGQRSFWITLLDAEGVVVKLVGSHEMLSELASTGLVEGSYRGEDAPYCGLFYLVYRLKRPFILVSTEHASPIDDKLAGAASPITDVQTGDVLGFLAISGHWWDSHGHTLGMAIVAAQAISHELSMRQAHEQILRMNESIQQMNEKLNTTVESVDFGLIYFAADGLIEGINEKAVRLLGIKQSRDDVRGQSIFAYIDPGLTMDTIRYYTDRGRACEYELTGPLAAPFIRKGCYPLYVTVRLVSQDLQAGYIMEIRERSDVHQRAARIAYAHARLTFDDIIGQSRAMAKEKELARLAAQQDTDILIIGEKGTGKELFAQVIHDGSSRCNGPFISIKCGDIPRSLIERDLFGCEKGIITSNAEMGNPGKFELAHGGTVFLDEMDELPDEVQQTILEILRTRQVRRVGGDRDIPVHARIIIATDRNLEALLRHKNFQDEMFYRFNILTINLAPLRKRKGDVEILANKFLENYNHLYHRYILGFTEETRRVLDSYSWPRNVSQLEHAVARAVSICKGDHIVPADLPQVVMAAMADTALGEDGEVCAYSEKTELLAVLEKYNYNMSQTAKHLGISRPTLYKKIKLYGLYKEKNTGA